MQRQRRQGPDGAVDSTVAERVALGVGLGAAAVLAAVATLLFESAGSLGRGVLAERTATHAGLVEATWRRLAADPTVWFDAAEGMERWASDAAPPAPPAREAADLGADASAFAALLDDARRARTSGGDLERSRATLTAAADLARGPVRRAAVGLERLRLELAAAARGSPTAAPGEAFRAVFDATPPDVLVDGLPAVAVALLAAAPRLDDAARAAAVGRLAAWLEGADLVLPEAPLRWRAGPGAAPALEPAPRVAALLDGLGALDADGAFERARGRFDAAARAHAVAERLAALGWEPAPAPAFLADGPGFWIAAGAPSGGARARWVPVGTLERRLAAAVEAAAIEPVALALALDSDAAGAPVGPPIRLAGLDRPAQLRHPDPPALAAEGGAGARAIAFALVALALLSLGAGWTTRAALARQRRLAALRSRWIAAVSHELRTPVAALTLTAARLERTRTERPERLPRYHAAIRSEAERLERLVAQVLDIARVERGQPPALRLEAVDPAAVLDDVAARAEALLADRGLALTVERGDLPARCVLDGLALSRAVENLVENAAWHSGGRAVLLAWRAADGDLAIEVRDDGAGLPDDPRLFEPFHRGPASDHARGVGLGLGIARELVRAHGGELVALAGAAAEPTRAGFAGAAFRLTLPLRRAPGGGAAAKERSA